MTPNELEADVARTETGREPCTHMSVSAPISPKRPSLRARRPVRFARMRANETREGASATWAHLRADRSAELIAYP